MKKNNMYFLFIPIADKKKFLSLLVSASNDEMAKEIVKQEMVHLFPGDQKVSDDEIIDFRELNCSEDILAEVMTVGPLGQLIEPAWIAIMKDGSAYVAEGIKDREEIKKQFKEHYGTEHPDMNFTGDLYSLVGEAHLVLLQVNFTDEFLNTVNFGKLITEISPTIH